MSTVKQMDTKVKKELNKVDASLPWRSSLEQSAHDLDDVQANAQAALVVLTDKQRKFVILVVSGSNQRDAYKEAGYSCKNDSIVDINASQLVSTPKVMTAMSAARLWHSLKYGISALWKRQQLVNQYTLCTTPGTAEWNPNAANKSMQLLMQMDGDIVPHNHASPNGNGSTTIHISTGVPARDPAQLSVNGLVLRDDGMITHVDVSD